MMIGIEAGASQNQFSMKLWIVHALSAAGQLRRLPTTDADLLPRLPFQKSRLVLCWTGAQR
jgi:hypothetical protein